MSKLHHHASHAVKKPSGFPEVLPPVLRSGVELHEGAWQVWVLSEVSGWLTCPHNHRTEQAARRCQMAWNDHAHAANQARLAALSKQAITADTAHKGNGPQ